MMQDPPITILKVVEHPKPRIALPAVPNLCADIIGSRPIVATTLDRNVVAVRDKFFERAFVSPEGIVDWQFKDGVVARIAITRINEVSREVYGKSLLPSSETTKDAEGYDSTGGARMGRVVLRVLGSNSKDREQMRTFLQQQNLTFASRYNSIVALNLCLLLTGSHPLENRSELQDANGQLWAFIYRLFALDDKATCNVAGRNTWAIGSPTPS